MNEKIETALTESVSYEKKRKKATAETSIVVTGNDNQIAVCDGNVLQEKTYRPSGGECDFEGARSWMTLLAVGLLTAGACYALAVLIGK